MVNRISCVIIDDEPDAINLVTELLQAFFVNITIVGTYTDWQEALDGIQNNIDIIFTDISMPEKNGITLLRSITGLQSEVIFITAFENYVLEAFEFHTSGYVLKPIDENKFKEAVNRAIARVQLKKISKYTHEGYPSLNARIGIPNNKGIDYVNIADIIYFESISKCTRIETNKMTLTSSYYIGKFKQALEGHLFYQIHRSFIINLNYIARYESIGMVIMTNKKEIPVARTEKENFLRIFTTITRAERGL